MVPLIRARPGIKIGELASMFGVREAEIRDDIREVLALCGVPPYLPHNYFVFQIEGDRVRIKFAEHLKRPIRLTLQEALAIVLALKGVGRGRVPPFGDAAERLREKIRASLRGDDRVVLDTLDRSVTGIETAEPVLETITRLQRRDGQQRHGAHHLLHGGARRRVPSARSSPTASSTTAASGTSSRRTRSAGGSCPFRVDRIRDRRADGPRVPGPRRLHGRAIPARGDVRAGGGRGRREGALLRARRPPRHRVRAEEGPRDRAGRERGPHVPHRAALALALRLRGAVRSGCRGPVARPSTARA